MAHMAQVMNHIEGASECTWSYTVSIKLPQIDNVQCWQQCWLQNGCSRNRSVFGNRGRIKKDLSTLWWHFLVSSNQGNYPVATFPCLQHTGKLPCGDISLSPAYIETTQTKKPLKHHTEMEGRIIAILFRNRQTYPMGQCHDRGTSLTRDT